MRRDLQRDEVHERLGVAREKLTVTYQGLDAAWGATPAPAPHVEDDGVPYVLFVGNIKPNKNLALLLHAFADVAARVPFRLVLAGRTDGFRTGDGAALALAERLGPRVRMAGEVSDTTLRALYAGATAFCLPSRLEGFGLPLLEAMASGCAVLCSTAGSLPEVAGGAALQFSPELSPGREQLAAALLRVATDEGLVRDLQSRGRMRAAAFSYTRCAFETTEVLQRELARLRPGGAR